MNWIESLDSAESKYTDAFAHLSETQLNFKPSAERWSIAQVIEHLNTTNSCYYKTFDEVLLGKGSRSFMTKIPGIPGLLGNMIYKASHESRQKKGKTVSVFQPSQSHIDQQVWSRFSQNQETLKGYIRQMGPEHLQIVISSPATSFIVYTVEKALDIITTHEHRHYLQAMEVKDMLPQA